MKQGFKIQQSACRLTKTGARPVWFDDLAPGFADYEGVFGCLDAPDCVPAGSTYLIPHGFTPIAAQVLSRRHPRSAGGAPGRARPPTRPKIAK